MSVLRGGVVALVTLLCVAGGTARAGIFDKIEKIDKARKKVAEINVKIDEEQERSLGRAVAGNLIARFGLVENPGLARYLNVLGSYLGSQSSRPELAYRFAVLDSDAVNAFAAPGGLIFVTRGTLEGLSDESELAGVLAHEIVHVAERHGVKSIEDAYRKKVITSGLGELAASRVGADPKLVAVFGELTDQITETLLVKGYSRELELEADRGGLGLASAAGYDGTGLVRFLGRLAAAAPDKSSPGMRGKTHPKASDRVEALEKAMSAGTGVTREKARFADLFAEATASLRK